MCRAPIVHKPDLIDHNTMTARILTLLDNIMNIISEIRDILQEETRTKIKAAQIANEAATVQTTIQMQQLEIRSADQQTAET